ncbi:hypothetical protein Clacol_001489 [Clathrus columnatus]|uniref:Uncharacterized protein n=1 Tax=Clathrus columnatus TaxID=1419009 RepID=A0AAV4ZYC8_9AGAM|nr:hypothetical protein Clacol_001489 [Clathrus columnatus]
MLSSQNTRQPLSEITLDSPKRIKRPLSPCPTLLSPSKRRVLATEGLSISPRRVPKRTLPEVLVSPSHTSKSNQALSPQCRKITSNVIVQLSASPEMVYSSKCNAMEPSQNTLLPAVALHSSLNIPREEPPIADRQSIHWPGFAVHCDSHISIPATASKTLNRISSDGGSDLEVLKENVKPRRLVSTRRGTSETNPFKDDRPSLKIFSPSSKFSIIQSDLDEETTVEQLL